MKKAIMNWSGGKDSALALYKIQQQREYEVTTLLTTVSQANRRISMHGVREELLKMQADSLGLPLTVVDIPASDTLVAYDSAMQQRLNQLKSAGNEYSVFGDIFLEDLRTYREEKLASIGLKGVFPLWKRDTREMLKEFLDLGFKTVIVCVNAKLLDKSFAGKIIDEQFLNDLPANVDPCGENGEFHTFVFDGPIFKNPIAFETGEVVYKTYETGHADKNWDTAFWYCDLLPATTPQTGS